MPSLEQFIVRDIDTMKRVWIFKNYSRIIVSNSNDSMIVFSCLKEKNYRNILIKALYQFFNIHLF